MLKKNVIDLVPLAVRWTEKVIIPPASTGLFKYIKRKIRKLRIPLSISDDVLLRVCNKAIDSGSVDILNFNLKGLILKSENLIDKELEIKFNLLLEDLNESLNEAIEYIEEFPQHMFNLLRQWRNENIDLIKQFNVNVGKGFGNLFYKSRKGNFIQEIRRQVLKDDYPEEADPDSYITMTDLQNIVKYLYIGPGKEFIDLGCGRGGPGMWISRETGANYLGIDICETAIEKANQRIEDFGLQKQARFQIADILSTKLPANHFDGAISIDALQLIQDPQLTLTAFHEINRILRRGALLLFINGEVHVPNRVNDFRPILEETAFEVQDYYEIPNWKERRSQVLSKILESRGELINDMGKICSSFFLTEAQVDLPILHHLRRVFVAAKKK